MRQRIRQALDDSDNDNGPSNGPVKVDETHPGGKHRNMSSAERKARADTGRGAAVMPTTVGMKDRRTNPVRDKGMKWPVHGATDRPRQPRLPGNGQDSRWCQSSVLPTHGPVIGPRRGSGHPQDRGCLGHPHRLPLSPRQREP